MKQAVTLKRAFITGLLGVLVLAGCSDAFLQSPREAALPPAGKGAGQVSITITGTGITGGERTLFPATPGSFSKYELSFTPKSGQDPVPAVTLYSTSPVSESIDIAGGTGQGRGVFSYDITIPGDLDAASLAILTLAGSSVKTIDLKNGPSGSFGLDAGYYFLKITRTKAGADSVHTEIVHIYESWTTEAAGPRYDFTGFSGPAEILEFLSAQPANMASSPYTVDLSGIDLEKDFAQGGDPLGLLYEALNGRYVSLDLRDCAGSSIPGADWSTANSRSDRDKIVSVLLPDSLASIGDHAFYDCSSLSVVISRNPSPPELG
jgi:hypothetical protein